MEAWPCSTKIYKWEGHGQFRASASSVYQCVRARADDTELERDFQNIKYCNQDEKCSTENRQGTNTGGTDNVLIAVH